MTHEIKVSKVHVYSFYYSQSDLHCLNEYYDKNLKSNSNFDHNVVIHSNFCEVIRAPEEPIWNYQFEQINIMARCAMQTFNALNIV